MGAAVLAGFFHYTRVGPIRVEEDEDKTELSEPVVHQVDPSVHVVDPKEPRP
jgi:formate dehydrogenase iron-sulfur subunit